jgi:hypothetical protein
MKPISSPRTFASTMLRRRSCRCPTPCDPGDGGPYDVAHRTDREGEHIDATAMPTATIAWPALPGHGAERA